MDEDIWTWRGFLGRLAFYAFASLVFAPVAFFLGVLLYDVFWR